MDRILTVVCVAAVAVAASAIAQAASTRKPPSMSPTPKHAAGGPMHDAGGHFALLRAGDAVAASPARTVPGATATAVAQSGALTGEFELDPASASYVRLSATRHGWVIPGRRGICLAVSEGPFISRVCNTLARADAEGLVIASKTASGTVFYGLVPDGASVTALDRGGSATAIQVADNVFMEADARVESISIHAAAGAVATTPAG